MAKRNRRNFQAIPFNHTLGPTGTSNEGCDTAAIITFGEDIYVISVDAVISWTDWAGTTELPCDVGFAHGDLSATEIAEAVNAEVTDPDDIIARERARRPVRVAGVLAENAVQGVLNDGEPVRTRLKFSIGDGHSLAFWLINRSGTTLTGTPLVEITGTIYGRWQR